MQKKDQNYIKKENTGFVLDMIRKYETISRAHLAKMTSMSATTVSRIVTKLIDNGLIKETNQYTSGVGRKAILLSVNANSIFQLVLNWMKRPCVWASLTFSAESSPSSHRAKK